MKKINSLLLIVIIAIAAFGVYSVFFKKEKPKYSLIDVAYGNVVQEVSETGTVKKGEKKNVLLYGIDWRSSLEVFRTDLGWSLSEGRWSIPRKKET